MFPVAITCYELDRRQVLRLDTTALEFGFSHGVSDEDAANVLDRFRDEKLISEDEPGSRIIWLALDESGAPLSPLPTYLDRAIVLGAQAEVERRTAMLADACEKIGWRDPAVPEPEGPPDPRIGIVARSARETPPMIRRLTPADLAADAVLAGRTLVVVPDQVESIVRTARFLYVRGWHQWEFFTLAKREAIFALETSLRLIAAETHDRPPRTFERLINGVGSDAAGDRLLSEWERGQSHRLRETRNKMVHDNAGRSIDWISWAYGEMEAAVRLINLMWARHRAHIPRELAWEDVP